MKIVLFQLTLASCFAGMAWLDSASAQAVGEDKADQKIKQVLKELDELREKEKALKKRALELNNKLAELERDARAKAEQRRRALEMERINKEIERKKQEELDKKNHYIKIELRGKLVNVKTLAQPLSLIHPWRVVANETTWVLDLSKKKELLAEAGKHLGKPILVTGHISTAKRVGFPYYVTPQGTIPSYPMDLWPQYPQIQPNRRPGVPSSLPGWEQLPPTVIVDSIRPIGN